VKSVTFAEFISRAASRVNRDLRDWALGDTSTAVLDVPLNPPSEREVIANDSGALSWVQDWRAAGEQEGISVTWANRVWSRVGTQLVPVRASVDSVDTLVSLAGENERWQRWRRRVSALRGQLGTVIDGALRSQLRKIGELDELDFDRLVATVSWLARHPDSGLRLRELPIRGL